jgi:hypothetical protein
VGSSGVTFSRETKGESMCQEYEQSQAIDAPPDEVFAWLADVDNLPN